MTITKNGETISIENENTLAAFLEAGWVEVKEEKPKKATPRKSTSKE